MKYYIEKDNQNRIIAKGITTDEAIIKAPLIEVTEEEFNNIDQYIPDIEEEIEENDIEVLNQRITELEQTIETLFGGVNNEHNTTRFIKKTV